MERRASPGRIAEFAAAARQLQRERDSAARTIPALLQHTPIAELPRLAQDPRLRTWGALEEMAVIISTAHAQDSRFALAVAELAVAVAETMPEGAYPRVVMAQIRSHAWKDYGKSLRFMARYDEALEALATAERTISGFGTLAHELAVVRINIAAVLQETQRHDESLAMLAECKKVFQEHGDTVNASRCALLEGTLLQRLGHHREARDVYRSLLAASSGVSHENRAALHLAIGYCSIDLEDFTEADENLMLAMDLFRRLGQPLNATRAELGRGRLFLRRAEFGRAVAHLRPVRREFLKNALAEEAGLCGLEIVQALIVLERLGAAEQLARKIVHEFMTANLSSRAVVALSYLTEALASRRAPASLAHDIHEYILSLRINPEREFTTNDRPN